MVQGRRLEKEDHRGNDQMSVTKKRERIAVIEETFYEGRACSLSALSAKTRVSYVICYGTIT